MQLGEFEWEATSGDIICVRDASDGPKTWATVVAERMQIESVDGEEDNAGESAGCDELKIGYDALIREEEIHRKSVSNHGFSACFTLK